MIISWSMVPYRLLCTSSKMQHTRVPAIHCQLSTWRIHIVLLRSTSGVTGDELSSDLHAAAVYPVYLIPGALYSGPHVFTTQVCHTCDIHMYEIRVYRTENLTHRSPAYDEYRRCVVLVVHPTRKVQNSPSTKVRVARRRPPDPNPNPSPLTRTLWGDLCLDAVACEVLGRFGRRGMPWIGGCAFQNSRTREYLHFFSQ